MEKQKQNLKSIWRINVIQNIIINSSSNILILRREWVKLQLYKYFVNPCLIPKLNLQSNTYPDKIIEETSDHE